MSEARLSRRAATAVWLARVASYRAGVVQRVVKRFEGLDHALDASLPELRAVIAPRGLPKPAPCKESGRPAEPALEQSRFREALGSALPVSVSRREGGLLVTYDDRLYPSRLRLLFDPPPALFVAGCDARRRLQALDAATTVAIVGTRAPSSYGLEMARLVAADLARVGVVVVSGVALGIDVCAQLAALGSAGAAFEPGGAAPEGPPSVGVLGCGIDVIHPRSNAAAFRSLRERGLLVSEFWPGTPPSAWRFPARNRVIAGLSAAVVVVEGSKRSGSRITADLAVEAGREVLAVPGEAGRRLSEAPHELLRNGAHLCESADDVLAALGLARSYRGIRPAGADGEASAEGHGAPGSVSAGEHERATTEPVDDATAVLDALHDASGAADELARRTGRGARAVLTALSALEIEGLVERVDGGVYRAGHD